MTLDDCKCAVCGSEDLLPMHTAHEDRARCQCCGCHMPVSMCKPKKSYAHKTDYDAIERASTQGLTGGVSVTVTKTVDRQAWIEAAAERFYNSLPGYRHVWSEASAVQQAAYIDAVRNLVDDIEGAR